MGKLIDRIPGSCLDIKFTWLGFENACCIARQASRCQQAFPKPCLVNLLSKDTNLVFSMSHVDYSYREEYYFPFESNSLTSRHDFLDMEIESNVQMLLYYPPYFRPSTRDHISVPIGQI